MHQRMSRVTMRNRAPVRVLITLLLAAGLFSTGVAQTTQMSAQIETAIMAGERAYIERGGSVHPTPQSDRTSAIELSLINAQPAASVYHHEVVATVHIPGAPADYVLSRDRSGCWRLPVHGHCWHAPSAR
jgi:hypothetical protein